MTEGRCYEVPPDHFDYEVSESGTKYYGLLHADDAVADESLIVRGYDVKYFNVDKTSWTAYECPTEGEICTKANGFPVENPGELKTFITLI